MVFVLAIATVKTAYDTFLTARAATAAKQAEIVALGARPTPPVDVAVNADWNNYNVAVDGYDQGLITLNGQLSILKGTQRTAELAVITALGYNGAGTYPCLDQWVTVVGAGAGILTYTNYIGASVKSTYLTILTSAPTQAYPLS